MTTPNERAATDGESDAAPGDGWGWTWTGASADRTTVAVPTSRGDRRVGVRYYAAGTDGTHGAAPVVLVHGAGIDAAPVSFRHVLPALARDRRVLAPDLPGHGGSEKPSLRYATGQFEAALAEFLADRGVERAAIVGASMGGAVALGYALSHPERVSRLALVGSYGLGGDAPWRGPASLALRSPLATAWPGVATGTRAGLRAYLAALVDGPVPDDLVADVARATRDPRTGRTLRRWQRREFRPTGFRTDYAGRLADLAVPTLLVHGRNDPLVPPRWSRRAARRVPDADLRLLGGGHWVTRERPDRLARAVQAWLSR